MTQKDDTHYRHVKKKTTTLTTDTQKLSLGRHDLKYSTFNNAAVPFRGSWSAIRVLVRRRSDLLNLSFSSLDSVRYETETRKLLPDNKGTHIKEIKEKRYHILQRQK